MTSITTTAAQALITAGKAAVEGELSRIEADLTAAKNAAIVDASTLANELAAYLAKHAAEVTTANTLIARANATAQPAAAVAGSPVPAAPAATLNTSLWTKVKTWFKAQGWKGYALVALSLAVIHYMYTHHIII